MAPSLRGCFYGQRRQPYVVSQVVLPRLRVSAEIHFLVDTGADRTVVHWGDRANLRTAAGAPLPADEAFAGMTGVSGIAGMTVEYGEEAAALLFRTGEGERRATEITACIALTPDSDGIPSLLGRDFLEDVRLDFNMPADALTLEWER